MRARMQAMRSTGRTGASVLERAFSLLEVLGSDSASIGLAELARRAGLPKATAYRLANQLVELHVLERAGQEYQLGLKLFELGNSVTRQRELREAALPFMEDLYEATHETIHLGVLDNVEVLYVEKIAGRRGNGVPATLGTRNPFSARAWARRSSRTPPPAAADRDPERPSAPHQVHDHGPTSAPG